MINTNSEKLNNKRTIMSNPKNFIFEANSLGVFYEHLIEGRESIGKTNLARLFEGNSSRGGINSTCIECWINTFEYIINNPEHKDNEIPRPFNMKPTNNYFIFVSNIKKIISNEIIESWKTLSTKKLSEEASKHNYNIGTKNSKSVQTLLQRMLEMADRRNKNIWSKTFPEKLHFENMVINYNMKNVPELRLLCKERNLPNAHLTKKEDIVKLLEENPLNSIHNENIVDYNKFNSQELKILAKTRKLTNYNNLKKDDLVKLHKQYDEDIKIFDDEINIEISEDINNDKIFDNKFEKKENEEISNINIKNELNKVFKFENKIIRTAGTFENPLFVVKDIADILDLVNYKNVYSKMDDYMKKDGVQFLDSIGRIQEMQVINESGLYFMIMRSNKPNAKLFQRKVYEDILPSIRKTGNYTIEDKYKFILENNRPLSQVINNTDIDKEAIDIEKVYNWSKNTNCAIIYIAYIGDGLVKIGFSDSKFNERLSKHISCESKYKQFVILDTFEVSGKPVEEHLHNLLNNFRFGFEKQKEIYKPSSSLKEFINNIQELLNDNDYKLKYIKLLDKYNQLDKENSELKLKIS